MDLVAELAFYSSIQNNWAAESTEDAEPERISPYALGPLWLSLYATGDNDLGLAVG